MEKIIVRGREFDKPREMKDGETVAHYKKYLKKLVKRNYEFEEGFETRKEYNEEVRRYINSMYIKTQGGLFKFSKKEVKKYSKKLFKIVKKVGRGAFEPVKKVTSKIFNATKKVTGGVKTARVGTFNICKNATTRLFKKVFGKKKKENIEEFEENFSDSENLETEENEFDYTNIFENKTINNLDILLEISTKSQEKHILNMKIARDMYLKEFTEVNKSFYDVIDGKKKYNKEEMQEQFDAIREKYDNNVKHFNNIYLDELTLIILKREELKLSKEFSELSKGYEENNKVLTKVSK